MAEVAAMLGLGRTKIYELMATGELAWIPIGRRGRRVEPRAVQEFIERHRAAGGRGGLTTDAGKPWSRSGAGRPATLRPAS
ncbi:AlpA family transcriptional regulator [Frankia sp. EI5c]|uniref:helix-turn-helix transcriptional regulator n=1 Tax=Frankia sp. EI5c TaxID=683316 RepID=UPI002100F7E7|nr:helix-turn-helix domain-containing protein [Frankia sp. EI5c]